MSEGELKRLLVDARYGDESVLELSFGLEVDKILDEVKKTFPMSKLMMDSLNGKITHLGSIGTYNPVDIVKWFVENFGEKNE